MTPLTTEEWAKSFDISTDLVLPAIVDYDEKCPFTSRQIAIRAVILQGVVAVACEVQPAPIIEWFHNQGVWEQVSLAEQKFLLTPDSVDPELRNSLRWRSEAEWTLLWVVGKVESLGLPTRQCDTRRLVDEIVPALGSDIESFLDSAQLRSAGALLAEDDRHYNLWCRYFQTRRENPDSLPNDLNLQVLYQRQYAFEWLHGIEAWDNIQCDA